MMIGPHGLIASIGLGFLTRIHVPAAAAADKTFGCGKRGKLCGRWLDIAQPPKAVPPLAVVVALIPPYCLPSGAR